VANVSPSLPSTEERAGSSRRSWAEAEERRPIVSKSNPLAPLGRGEGVGFKRVAVFDFDVHHGNGTEAILVNRPGVAFFSVHLYPFYPGTGAANAGNNCFNYPVEPGTPREAYRAVLERALGDLKNYRPDLLAVSAGFDAYVRDPLGGGVLEVEDFHRLGQSLRSLGVPMFSLLEGGYSKDLPELILAYLEGVERNVA
jgi:acetoin utilization deacetylase AcuC-like enzyme